MFNRVRMIMAVALAQAFGGTTPVSLKRMAADHNRVVDAIRSRDATPHLPTLGQRIADSVGRLIPLKGFRGNGSRRPNGAQECARRVRQFANGHNAQSRIWTDSQSRRWHTDSHGVHRGFYWDSSGQYQTV